MVTIVGNGMGAYTLQNLPVKLEAFDTIVCDKNFEEDGAHIRKLGYKEAKAYLLSHYDTQNILYVVTGSPLFYSAGILLAKALPKKQVRIIDNTSSLSYLLAAMHLSVQETGVFSLHGRKSCDLTQLLTHPYTFILCDNQSVARLQQVFADLPADAIEVTIGYKLGYADEAIQTMPLDAIEQHFDLNAPYVLLIKRCFTPPSAMSKDDAFATERGMITKHYKRHLSLQRLNLLPNQLLWDVGAGSGSCAIEAYKRYKVRTILFEKQPQRCAFIKENLASHYVCDATLLEGDAALMFESCQEDPDRIFVGGGGSSVIAKLPYLYERLAAEGVMLINAITLKNLTQMIAVLSDAKIAYEVISLSLTTYKGSLDLVEPERQLFQIKVVKA